MDDPGHALSSALFAALVGVIVVLSWIAAVLRERRSEAPARWQHAVSAVVTPLIVLAVIGLCVVAGVRFEVMSR